MKNLTGKQLKIFKFIVEWQKNKGYPPTQEEIRNHFGFGSLNAARSHLALIEKKGFLHLNYGKARGIQLSSPAPVVRQQNGFIPLLGSIAAGNTTMAEQNYECQLPVSPALFGRGELFALNVRGDSMIGAGIRDGDIAIIQRRECVENGEIAAVLIENEATLKRVFLFAHKLVLKAENPAYKALRYTGDKRNFIRILGRYQGIIRTQNSRCFNES
jgi:repressor LexA